MLAPYGLLRRWNNVAALAVRLQLLTTVGSGLLYSRAAARGAPGVSLQLNAFALLVVRRLRLAGVVLPATLTALRATWSAALETGLMVSVDGARAYATRHSGGGGGGGGGEAEAEAAWGDYETLALCRLALGRGWAAPTSYPELTMAALDAHAASLSTAGQAAYVLAHLYPTTTAADDDAGWQPAWDDRAHARTLAPLLSGFVARLRVTARTAYVASAGGGASAAGARENALVLAALATAKRAGAPAALATNLDKLANYVARGGDAVGVGAVRAVGIAPLSPALAPLPSPKPSAQPSPLLKARLQPWRCPTPCP